MRTRIKDFLNTDTHQVVRSFQYQTERHGPWVYPHDAKGELLTWSKPAQRDKARACFTSRRSVTAAYIDLARARLN